MSGQAQLAILLFRHPHIGAGVMALPASGFSWLWWNDRTAPGQDSPLAAGWPIAMWGIVIVLLGLAVRNRRFHNKAAAIDRNGPGERRAVWSGFSRHHADDAWEYRFLSIGADELALWTAGENHISGLLLAAEKGAHPTTLRRPNLAIPIRQVKAVSSVGGMLRITARSDDGTEKHHTFWSDEGSADLVRSLSGAGWDISETVGTLKRWDHPKAKDGAVVGVVFFLMLIAWSVIMYFDGDVLAWALLSALVVGAIGVATRQCLNIPAEQDVAAVHARPARLRRIDASRASAAAGLRRS